MSELPLLRDISNAVFQRPHQIEVAEAVAKKEGSFEAKEVIEAVRQRALAAGVEPPSDSAVRKNLQRLLPFRVVNHVQANSRGQSGIWTREPGVFWDWLAELPELVES